MRWARPRSVALRATRSGTISAWTLGRRCTTQATTTTTGTTSTPITSVCWAATPGWWASCPTRCTTTAPARTRTCSRTPSQDSRARTPKPKAPFRPRACPLRAQRAMRGSTWRTTRSGRNSPCRRRPRASSAARTVPPPQKRSGFRQPARPRCARMPAPTRRSSCALRTPRS